MDQAYSFERDHIVFHHPTVNPLIPSNHIAVQEKDETSSEILPQTRHMTFSKYNPSLEFITCIYSVRELE